MPLLLPSLKNQKRAEQRGAVSALKKNGTNQQPGIEPSTLSTTNVSESGHELLCVSSGKKLSAESP